MPIRRLAVLTVCAVTFIATAAVAQPLGSFRWQIQPYCNLITVNVVQTGAVYTLDGTDDRCGAAQAASIVGIAFLNPNGTVGFGLTEVLPGGVPVHTEATILISTLNGTWRDSAGNNGTFVFTAGAGIGGAPRPIPSGGIAPASITSIQIANNAVSGANIVDASITSADILDAPRSEHAGANQQTTLGPVDIIVRSVTINAPTAGKVNVMASGYFRLTDDTTIDSGRCTITTGTTIDTDFLIIVTEQTVAALFLQPFAATRGFDVAAGAHTFNLVCDIAAGHVDVADTNMTAIFTAQ